LTANAFLGGSGNISKLPISNKLPNFAHPKGLLIKTWALLKCRKIVIKAGPSNLDLIPLKFHVKEVGADTKLIQKGTTMKESNIYHSSCKDYSMNYNCFILYTILFDI
jgi:hypothetical protein